MENIIKFREQKIKYLEKYNNGTDDYELVTEGFGSFLSKIGNFFKNKLNAIKEIFNVTSKEKQALGDLNARMKIVNSEVSVVSKSAYNVSTKGGEFFKAVGSILVPTIPGIKVDLLTLSTLLSSKTDVLINGVKPILSEIDTYISKINNDVDFRMSVAPNDLSKRVKNISDGLNKDLVKIIDTKQVDDKTQLKNLLPNLSSLKTITDNFKSSIIVKDMKLIGEIYDLNLAISTKIDTLIEMLNKGEKVNISKVRLDELCDILKFSSQLITDTSAYIRLTDAGHKILAIIVQKLEKIN